MSAQQDTRSAARVRRAATTGTQPVVAAPADVARIAQLFPSFRDFVDDALFHPAWGYYSTGKVRFGEGGHYDTFPLALSPVFGQMLARYGYRVWRRAGQPHSFEICELGAGNGQLCLDVFVSVSQWARQSRGWDAFAQAFRYRIVERSPALIARQRQHLGPLAARVTWTQADLSQRAAQGAPFGACGLVFANEVLDCLAHHKIVPRVDGKPGVVFVVPTLAGPVPASARRLPLVAGLRGEERAVPWAHLARALSDERLRRRLRFHEVILPVRAVPGLRPFLQRHYPEFFEVRGRLPEYFAAPAIESLIGNTARLYRTGEALWIDYGDTREFHLMTPAKRRVFAGPPRSGATIYRRPGCDDITFMVDFSVVAAAAARARVEVAFYGGQGELARRSGLQLDRRARDLIVRYRALDWALALIGIGAERAWRHTGLTWSSPARHAGRLREEVRRGVAEFLGRRHSLFKLVILRPAADSVARTSARRLHNRILRRQSAK